MSEAAVGPGLADTILAIRGELKRARDEGGDDELRFRLGPVELELALEVGAEDGFEGGLKVWVVSIGPRRGRSTAEKHMIRLTLHPEDLQGEDAVIHGLVPNKPVG